TKFPDHTTSLDPISANSNRYNKLLEFLVTYTKQRTALISNRYKIALVAQRVFASLSCNAPLAVAVKMRGDWRPSACAVTIPTQMSLENTV
ncbi:MAG TPA: hypothetical protein VGR39_02680, partial [Candidatus Acidoferrales bacterium]|nr:hypothetical protein [Candidatus Acidoferrales bacterium]